MLGLGGEGEGEELVAVPALRLDASFIHLHRADRAGNAVYLNADPYFDDLFAAAADRCFVSCEQVVDTAQLASLAPPQAMLVMSVRRWFSSARSLRSAPVAVSHTRTRFEDVTSAKRLASALNAQSSARRAIFGWELNTEPIPLDGFKLPLAGFTPCMPHFVIIFCVVYVPFLTIKTRINSHVMWSVEGK